MLAEHSFQALGLDRQQLAAGQFGEPGEVQQLALREQHQQGADGVVQQHRLDPALRAGRLEAEVGKEAFRQAAGRRQARRCLRTHGFAQALQG